MFWVRTPGGPPRAVGDWDLSLAVNQAHYASQVRFLDVPLEGSLTVEHLALNQVVWVRSLPLEPPLGLAMAAGLPCKLLFVGSIPTCSTHVQHDGSCNWLRTSRLGVRISPRVRGLRVALGPKRTPPTTGQVDGNSAPPRVAQWQSTYLTSSCAEVRVLLRGRKTA